MYSINHTDARSGQDPNPHNQVAVGASPNPHSVSQKGFAMTMTERWKTTMIFPSFQRRGLRGGSLSWQSGLALTPEKGLNAVRMSPDSHRELMSLRGAERRGKLEIEHTGRLFTHPSSRYLRISNPPLLIEGNIRGGQGKTLTRTIRWRSGQAPTRTRCGQVLPRITSLILSS